MHTLLQPSPTGPSASPPARPQYRLLGSRVGTPLRAPVPREPLTAEEAEERAREEARKKLLAQEGLRELYPVDKLLSFNKRKK
jgi:hypothetical protein